MPRGGSRPGAGRPKGAKNKNASIKIPKDGIPQDIKKDAKKAQMTPVEFLLWVINNSEDLDTRIKAAQIAAPFVHPRLAEQRGSKDEKKDRAKAAGKGRFAPSAPPRLKAVK